MYNAVARYFIVHKPFDVLSQFTREVPDHKVLADLYNFPAQVYPVGRLDRDSEGLLLLTDDKKVNTLLLDPKREHPRTYWVQVEGDISENALNQLRHGVSIRINKKDYNTLPAKAKKLNNELHIPERTPPIRFRKNIPTSWMELTLTEGKNRQVRRMCAKVGFPVLRLIRVQVEKLKLDPFEPGKVEAISKEKLYRLLNL